MNLPNSLTLLRIFFVPVLIVILLTRSPNIELWGFPMHFEFWGVLILLLAAATDWADGYVARKRLQVTTLGILLDPIADKLLISAAFVSLVDMQLVPAWMVVIIIGREFTVLGLRNIALAEGFTIEASVLGKTKMVLQVCAVAVLIAGARHNSLKPLALLLLWLVVASALTSAAQYFLRFWGHVDDRIKQRRRLSMLESRKKSQDAVPLSESDRQRLLLLARQAITEAVTDRKLPANVPHDGVLGERRGVFVTAHVRGELRGCIGTTESVEPLADAVVRCGACAALQDPRFAPLRVEELPDLQIEISVLSPLARMRPEEIEIGRHGLVISDESHRGLLLPQVAVEHHLEREEFLGETCRKAHLPREAWRWPTTRLEGFTCEVFFDKPHSRQTGETSR